MMIAYITMSRTPHKTCKVGSTEIVNHSTVYEKVNLKEVICPRTCKKHMADLGI